MIEYDGPGPVSKEDAELKPASGFERLRAKALRSLRGESARQKLGRDLYWALREIDAPKARRLILAGASMDEVADPGRGMAWEAPLVCAAQARGPFGVSAIHFLLSVGADPDAELRASRRGPANLALLSGNWASAQALLRHSRREPQKDEDGLGPRLAAAIGLRKAEEGSFRIFGSVEATFELLRELGADPNERLPNGLFGRSGSGPLALTAHLPSAVEELLAAGADANARDDLGATPLMRAASRQALRSVELLLAAGANPLAVDHEGRDALDWLIHTEQKLSSSRTTNWGRSFEPTAIKLMDAGLARLGRSRLKGLKFEEWQEAPEWIGRLRAEEERHELSSQTGAAAKAGRSARI